MTETNKEVKILIPTMAIACRPENTSLRFYPSFWGSDSLKQR